MVPKDVSLAFFSCWWWGPYRLTNRFKCPENQWKICCWISSDISALGAPLVSSCNLIPCWDEPYMGLLSIILEYVFLTEKKMSKCFRDKELCAPASPDTQDMNWHRAQPQCQLNRIGACIGLAFRNVWMNTRKWEWNYINHLISVILFFYFENAKNVFFYYSQVISFGMKIYQNKKWHQTTDVWEWHHVDDVYFITDRIIFLLCSSLYVINYIGMLNKKERIFVWQRAGSPHSRLSKRMAVGLAEAILPWSIFYHDSLVRNESATSQQYFLFALLSYKDNMLEKNVNGVILTSSLCSVEIGCLALHL